MIYRHQILTTQETRRSDDGFQIVVERCPYCGARHYHSLKSGGARVASQCLRRGQDFYTLPAWEEVPPYRPGANREAWKDSHQRERAHRRITTVGGDRTGTDDAFYTVQEASKLLGKSPDWIYRRIQTLQLMTVHVPGLENRKLLSKKQIDDLVVLISTGKQV